MIKIEGQNGPVWIDPERVAVVMQGSNSTTTLVFILGSPVPVQLQGEPQAIFNALFREGTP